MSETFDELSGTQRLRGLVRKNKTQRMSLRQVTGTTHSVMAVTLSLQRRMALLPGNIVLCAAPFFL